MAASSSLKLRYIFIFICYFFAFITEACFTLPQSFPVLPNSTHEQGMPHAKLSLPPQLSLQGAIMNPKCALGELVWLNAMP